MGEHVTEWAMVVCLVHKLTIGFAVVGVINGVFIQETFKVAASDDDIMVRSKRKALSAHERKMKTLFSVLDMSNDGSVDLDEFLLIADSPVIKTWLAAMDLETDDLLTLFYYIDGDGSGQITMDELVKGVAKL